jgi:hypothetical protein
MSFLTMGVESLTALIDRLLDHLLWPGRPMQQKYFPFCRPFRSRWAYSPVIFNEFLIEFLNPSDRIDRTVPSDILSLMPTRKNIHCYQVDMADKKCLKKPGSL